MSVVKEMSNIVYSIFKGDVSPEIGVNDIITLGLGDGDPIPYSIKDNRDAYSAWFSNNIYNTLNYAMEETNNKIACIMFIRFIIRSNISINVLKVVSWVDFCNMANNFVV